MVLVVFAAIVTVVIMFGNSARGQPKAWIKEEGVSDRLSLLAYVKMLIAKSSDGSHGQRRKLTDRIRK